MTPAGFAFFLYFFMSRVDPRCCIRFGYTAERLDPVMHGVCSPQCSYSVLFPSRLQCSRPSCAFHSPHSFHYQKPATPTPFTHFNRPPPLSPATISLFPVFVGLIRLFICSHLLSTNRFPLNAQHSSSDAPVKATSFPSCPT